MERLVVSGWEDDASALLQALREHAGLETVAVGDEHPVHLVRARAATKLACFQHTRQMVRDLDFDVLLIAAPEHAEDLATLAAVRGADVLLLGDQMDAEALQAAATSSFRHGGALAVLRPMLRTSGLAFVTDLIDAEPRWSPSTLALELWDERPALQIARDGLSVATRLLEQAPAEVVASVAGPDRDEPAMISFHLRGESGAVATVTAYGDGAPRMRLHAQAASGTVEVESLGGESRVSLTPFHGERERSVLRDPDVLVSEGQRTARIRGGDALDARFALREAAVLHALEEAMATACPAPVGASTMRSILRLLTGGAAETTPTPRATQPGRLHLVSGAVSS